MKTALDISRKSSLISLYLDLVLEWVKILSILGFTSEPSENLNDTVKLW